MLDCLQMNALANNKKTMRTARDILHYLAYGSNLHPYRLIQRVPHARLVTTTRLDGYDVSFSKRSHDGSSKCNLAMSECTDSAAHVAIYKIPMVEKHLLDAAEGLGKGYDHARYNVRVANKAYDVFTYAAASTHIVRELLPYDWYKSMVIEGARYHGFSDDYIGAFESQPSWQDPDIRRRLEAEELLNQMQRQR